MNRVIKFRVWSREAGAWLCEDSQYLRLDGECVIPSSWSTIKFHTDSEDYIIQQFTGLKDVNGIEIYEGDIIKNKTVDEEYASPAVVVWARYEEVGWAVAYRYKGKEMKVWDKLSHQVNGVEVLEEFQLNQLLGHYEVIGNVFENKELL